MKHLNLMIISTGIAICISSCVSANVHNSVKTPIFEDKQVVDVAASISPFHASGSVAIKVAKHTHVLASGYVTGDKTSGEMSNFGDYKDIGLGQFGKLMSNIYVGAYYTFGKGYNNQEQNILFDHADLECSYLRHSLSGYLKFNNKVVKPYVALRMSYFQYEYYRYYEGSDVGLFGSSVEPVEVSDFGHLLLEPVVGMDINLGKGFYIYMQQIYAMPVQPPFYNGDNFVQTYPKYLFTTLRLGIGYIWKKRDR